MCRLTNDAIVVSPLLCVMRCEHERKGGDMASGGGGGSCPDCADQPLPARPNTHASKASITSRTATAPPLHLYPCSWLRLLVFFNMHGTSPPPTHTPPPTHAHLEVVPPAARVLALLACTPAHPHTSTLSTSARQALPRPTMRPCGAVRAALRRVRSRPSPQLQPCASTHTHCPSKAAHHPFLTP